MVRSTRRISTKTGCQIQVKLAEISFKVSYGTIIHLKPYYVQQSPEREKENCLCKSCLNLHLRFNELNNLLIDKQKIEKSTTKYFSYGCECENSEISFTRLDCIFGKCDNGKLTPMFQLSDYNNKGKLVRFNQFVADQYEYTSKKAEKKFGTQTVKKEIFEPLIDFDKKCSAYLLHRFEITDVHNWLQILSDSTLGYIFHQYYSENIIYSPKLEPHDAHFASKQTSLHCTAVYDNEKDPKYAYHISDNKGHDSAFTLLVMKDLMEIFNLPFYSYQK